MSQIRGIVRTLPETADSDLRKLVAELWTKANEIGMPLDGRVISIKIDHTGMWQVDIRTPLT